METNFFGPVALTRLILPGMRERGSGVVVNMSSTAGIEAKPSRTMYCASKFALEAFSEALSEEVRPVCFFPLPLLRFFFSFSFFGGEENLLVEGKKNVC
jgi:hypothetical protein